MESLLHRQKYLAIQKPQRDLSTEMQYEGFDLTEQRVPEFDVGTSFEIVSAKKKIESSPKRSLPVRTIPTDTHEKVNYLTVELMQ